MCSCCCLYDMIALLVLVVVVLVGGVSFGFDGENHGLLLFGFHNLSTVANMIEFFLYTRVTRMI